MISDNPRIHATFLLIILAIIWGTSFILIKQGLKVFAPDEVGALRVSAASLFLLPIALVKLREVDKQYYWRLLASGLMGIFIPAFLFAKAQTKLDSSVAGIMNSLTPIFTLVISAFFFGQRFRLYTLFGILLSFGGTALLTITREGGSINGINPFALLVVVACLFYGSNINFIKFKIHQLDALTITSVSIMLIGPLALTYLFAFSDFTHKLSTHEGALKACLFVILLGIMSTSVATILFNKLIKISTPLFASSSTYIIPIVALLWGVIDGEKLGLGHIIGMSAIVIGVYVANKK